MEGEGVVFCIVNVCVTLMNCTKVLFYWEHVTDMFPNILTIAYMHL